MPGAVGLRVVGAEPRCAGELGELHRAGLGDARGALRAVGGEGAAVALVVRLLHAAQRGGRAAGAGAADRDEAQPLDDARDEFAVERAAR